VLKVKDVDLNVTTNTKAHHTKKYDHNRKLNTVVLRRGQHFQVDVEFNRPLDPKADWVSLRMQTGKITHGFPCIALNNEYLSIHEYIYN
jgi:hypothetical protein